MTTQTLTKTKWNLDTKHSEIQFKAKHLMISTVTGTFKTFDATFETQDDDFATAQVSFSADVNSISTGSEERDGHLKSADFFNAEKFPKLSFISTSVEKLDEDNFILNGNLTILDVTRPVYLNVEVGGIAKDPWGMTRAGFTMKGKINRKDFGLSWNVVTDAGGILVSEEIKLNASVQFIKVQLN
ncbi:MAG: YceI family protein [Bacteroidia bacterium]|nr:YceI family protein [Bacteroidia bacterium]